MTNSKTLLMDFIDSLTLPESRGELESIAYLTLENILGLSKTQVLSAIEIDDDVSINRLKQVITRLNRHEPIQYILGEALFFGRSFNVNPSVLIPRPETEDLVRLVIDHSKRRNKKCKIADIGTGSGCIAVTLALELPDCEIIATDVSDDALNVAAGNAHRLDAKVRFEQHDILAEILPFSIDIIVSNPPYISRDERDNMPKNVVHFEPDRALFVDAGNPLVFYRALLSRAKESLLPHGMLAVEINERYGEEICQLLTDRNFQEVEVVKDVYGKDRIVKGILSS